MSGAQTKWWEAAPLASQTPPPAPTEVTAGNWWEAAPKIQDLAPEMGGIVDEPGRRAPLKVIARASMFPNTADRIPVYAKAMNIPAERFATVDGQIVYQDTDGKYVRVEPSVAGSKDPIDAAQRVAGYAAGSVGPAIPALASIGAGLATRGNLNSVMTAGAAGGAGDVARQSIGNMIEGNPTGDIDWLNVAGQGMLGAGGQGLGRGIQAAFERVPPGLARADRAWMRGPGNVDQARANAELMEREGITGMMGPVTDRGTLIHADRQMMRNEELADPMRRVVQRVNTQEVPAAMGRAADRVSPNGGVDQAARDFAIAAEKVKEFPRQQGNRAADPFYAPLNNSRVNMMSPDLAALESAPALQSAMTKARRTYANKHGTPPDTPDFTLWDLTKKQLDADYAAAGSPFSPADRASAGGIDSVRQRLVGALEAAYPEYGTAKAIARPGMMESERLSEGMVGRLAKADPDEAAPTALARAFSTANTTPTAIAEARQAFANAGQLGAWEDAFAAYIRSVADKSGRVLASGDTGNVAGKIHAELFGNEQMKAAAAAALGGKNTPAYRQFAETMRAMEIASKIPAMGSQTATDVGKIGAASSPTANAAAAAVRSANVFRWPAQLEKFAQYLQDRSASKAAARLAAQYTAGPSMNAAGLDMVRIMHPAVGGLLSVGGRGSAGGVGLLGTGNRGKFEPYQPPLPR